MAVNVLVDAAVAASFQASWAVVARVDHVVQLAVLRPQLLSLADVLLRLQLQLHVDAVTPVDLSPVAEVTAVDLSLIHISEPTRPY